MPTDVAARPRPPIPPPAAQRRRTARALGASLGATLVATWGLAVHAACPAPAPGALLERFIAARCVACWKQPPPALKRAPPDAWVMDWVVPASAGPDAPQTSPQMSPQMPPQMPPQTAREAFLHGAALDAAAARAARHGDWRHDEALTVSHPLPQRSALDLWADQSRLPDGRIELRLAARFTSQRPLPAGLQGWLALVERVPRGDQESPVDRQVVRAVVGPLAMDGLAQRPLAHLRSVPAPEQGDPDQLAVLAWVETARGRIIAVGRSALPDCPKR